MPVVGAGCPTGPCPRVVVGVVGMVEVGVIDDDVDDDVDDDDDENANENVEDEED